MSQDLGEVTTSGKEGAKAGDKGIIAIRPEQVRISHPSDEPELKNHFLGKVHDFLYVGDVTTYIVELSNGAYIEALAAQFSTGTSQIF